VGAGFLYQSVERHHFRAPPRPHAVEVMSIKITVDRGLCMGAGECVYEAPQLFALDDERKSVVVGEGEIDAAIRAAESCPNFAIRVEVDGKSVI
jgi:ferredoxin